jgi:hypothetical protein
VRPTSDEFDAALGAAHRRITKATCTLPDGTVLPLKLRSGASVQAKRGTGSTRSMPNLSIAPQPGVDLYKMLATPLSVFHVEHGINFGAGRIDTVPVFHGDAAAGSLKIGAGDITLSLVDMWGRIEEAAFAEPFAPAPGTRAEQISAAILGAIPTADIRVDDDGGSSPLVGVWGGSRAQFITNMAADGRLEVSQDAAGVWVIRREPVINPGAPVYTFKTGVAGNIIRGSASRSTPFNKIYNTVVVVPANNAQTWSRQEVTLQDTTDPRHRNNIGVRAAEYRSATASTEAEAMSIGQTVLQQLLRSTETATYSAVSHPGLEPGDNVAIAHARTDVDPGYAATHLLDSFDLALDDGSMSASSSDASLYPLVEV